MIPVRFSALASTNDVMRVEVYIGGVITGGAWVAASDAVEANITGTLLTGDLLINTQFVSAQVRSAADIIRSIITAAADIAGTTDPISIVVTNLGAGPATIHASITWREIY